jgi:hypothetical protein
VSLRKDTKRDNYAYVAGNPLAYADPSGNCPWCATAIGGAIVGGIYGTVAAYGQGGSFSDAAVGLAVGAATGALAGATFGAFGTIVVGATAAGAGDFGGQAI